MYRGICAEFQPDYEGLIDTLTHKGTPKRVYHMELFQDPQIQNAIFERFELGNSIQESDPYFEYKKLIAVQRICGFDYVRTNLDGFEFLLNNHIVEDTASLKRTEGRVYRDEHTGYITSWEEFEKFPWPNPNKPECTQTLEWFQKNLPEDMCIISGPMSHFCEYLTWLMGYETFCYALYDQRDLVWAIADKLRELYRDVIRRYLEFDRLKIFFAADDMGFKGGLLFSAQDMRDLVLEGHKEMASLAHDAGRLYLLHSCGNLEEIMDDLIDDVNIDGKHSFEDTIKDVRELKKIYGKRIALIGGIDVDFLCRADEETVRQRVRDTVMVCQPGGGYCLGTGNSVANYIPLENYLAMLDEGRLFN